jgi:hypothetical protein
MIIPTAVIAPICVLSFLLLGFQYWRINPHRRVLNLQFCLMLGVVVLMLTRTVMPYWLGDPSVVSMVLLAITVLCFGITLLLFRTLPPPSH